MPEAPSKKLWFRPKNRRNQGLAGYLHQSDVRTDMSTPLDANGLETGAILSRHFTRAGRDPLALAPFEERMIEGRSVRVPSSWAPGGLSQLTRGIGDATSSEFLTQKAKSFASDAEEQGLLQGHESEVLADELAWILARGMGWAAEESGMWVGVLNLHHFCEPVTQRFDLAGLRQAGRCLMIAAAGQAKKADSPGSFSLGWTNGAGFLLVAGIPYDSSRAVGILGCVSAMILGEAALASARLAERCSDLVQRAESDIVLAGLSHAKAKVAELPPTGQVTQPGTDSGRWALQTQDILNEAVSAVTSHGVLGAYPTAPQAILEAETWLDPISRLAEAIPSLQVPDLAARPEMRSSLKAMGLAESQRGAVLTAISTGGSILEAGVPEAKAPSLKTALGSWSFHPNAQVMMGAAVAPFVAGVLQHRIILPEGIPDEFRASVMSAAQRFGLTGALPYVHGSASTAEPASLTESNIDRPLIEQILDTESEHRKSLHQDPAPEEDALLESDDEQAEESAGALADEIENIVSEPVPSLVPPPLPELEETTCEALGIAVTPESTVAPETQSETDSVLDDIHSDEDAVNEVSANEAEKPLETEPEIQDSVSLITEVESDADAGSTQSESMLPQAAALAAAGTAAAIAFVAPREEKDPEAGPDHDISMDEPAAAAVISKTAVDSSDFVFVNRDKKAESQAGASPSLGSLREESLLDSGLEAAAPSAHIQPTFWSKSLNISSQGIEIVLHAFRRTESGPIEAAVTTHQLTAMNKILLDSLLTSVNLGLSKGVSIKDYARSITQPGLVRDILRALADLSEN